MKPLPDALAIAVGRIIADVQRDARKEIDHLAMEARATIAELREKIAILEHDARVKIASVKDGNDGAPGERGEKGDPGEPGKDGIDGKDGVDGKDGAPGLDGMNGKDGADGINGIDGMAGLNGKDGRDGVDGKDGAPGKDGLHGKDGRDGIDGKDGIGLAGGMVNQQGNLILTLSNGEAKEIGHVVGRDGKDGFGFEDMNVELADDGRTFILRFVREDRTKEFRLNVPALIYRDIWKEGTEYEIGDAVTSSGSLWISREVTKARPGDGNSAWRLAVKRGREGKEGPPGPKGEKGDVAEHGEPLGVGLQRVKF